jgi:2-haloacid dehalogenase
MSNGNVALMTNLAKFGALPWDLVLGTDLVKHYKPDREMYMSAPFYLDLKPEEVMMCQLTNSDLQAARKWACEQASFIGRTNTAVALSVSLTEQNLMILTWFLRASSV